MMQRLLRSLRARVQNVGCRPQKAAAKSGRKSSPMSSTNLSLFAPPSVERPLEGVCWLHGFARSGELWPEIEKICALAPLRHMHTRGGVMSVAMTNCGTWGWTSDRNGYQYVDRDPQSGNPWPPLPSAFARLAREAAHVAGFRDFVPDACLINRYVPGAQMGIHQDRDERDFTAPIVSVSLGLPARFLIGSSRRRSSMIALALQDGDVVVWGGPSRLAYHGVTPLAEATSPTAPLACRYNLTFRRARATG
jgi:DNA oxidative demethylase